MGMTEGEVWESTPRKILALIDQKKEIEKVNQKNLAIYIASYVWGNDPDKDKGEVMGIDKPVDSTALSQFYF